VPVRQGTYSIVARDEATGEMGVAVQSHWFSVGSVVSWAQPGVGAVATQSIAEPAYGPRALERLGAGEGAQAALAALTAEDPQAAVRQVAVVDARGEVAVHTGDGCIAFAGHQVGDGFSCQANMMASPTVWPAMAEAFSAAQGDLAECLLAALDAAEAEGGDVRGRQSAALVVVPAEGDTWLRRFDLRVEDDPEPLVELRRVLQIARAYEVATEGDDLIGQQRYAEAGEVYQRALELAPDNDEVQFFAGLSAVQAGNAEAGLGIVRQAMAANPGWAQLLPRLDDETLPGVSELRQRLADAGDLSL
jgi:uncharacterized Ntn-hydrolase superfamily protein